MRVCSDSGCPTLYLSAEGSRCSEHRKAAERARRPNGTPYARKDHRAFRAEVLTRDPVCVLCGLRIATVADHYPHSRNELIELGLDPNDPAYGRGLDKQCHDRETARNQPGGWNQQ